MLKTTLQEVLDPQNIEEAIDHLKTKKNTCGVDGVFLHDLADYWETNREEIISAIREHSFDPGLAREIEIVQGNGKRRIIVSMNSIDRLLLRCINQRIQVDMEGFFNENSHAYQPGKGVQTAIQKIIAHINDGREWVAEIDIENFFDNIPLDSMETILEEHIEDTHVRSIIVKFLHIRIQSDFQIRAKQKGLLQGNPLSPWLSNLYLHDLDEDLTEKGFALVRFSDNIYIMARSYEDALNKLNYVRKQLEKKHLPMNVNKSGVYNIFNRKILGKVIAKSGKNNHVYAHKPRKNQYLVYSRWRTTAIQKVDKNYHLINDGILTRRDFTILFENEENKRYLPVEAIDSINIYSNIVLSGDFLQYVMQRNLIVNVFN